MPSAHALPSAPGAVYDRGHPRPRIVVVPQMMRVEKLAEVPQIHIVEVVKKRVEKPVYQWADRHGEMRQMTVDRPGVQCGGTAGRVGGVPQVEYREVVKQVPGQEVKPCRQESSEPCRRVSGENLEISQVIYEERPADVPQVHNLEAITQVPKVSMQQVPKRVPKVQLQVEERVVDVPLVLQVAQLVVLPEVLPVELISQVPQIDAQPVDELIPSVRSEAPGQIVEAQQVMYEQFQVVEAVCQVLRAEAEEVVDDNSEIALAR